MRILGIETSCDETSVAIVNHGKEVEFHQIYSQIQEHAQFMGVVPEIASRMHFEVLFPMIQESLTKTGFSWDDIDAIAVTREPGLLGSLLIGFTVAKTLAYLLDKPLIPVNHLWGHLYAPFLKDTVPVFPYGGLVVSGGHSLLAMVNSYDDVKIIGSTIDDSIGECYDKVAKMLGLGYPGGPIIDKRSQDFSGNTTYSLPSIQLNQPKDKYIFSFSGLKTATRRLIEKEGKDIKVDELCFIFQQKAIEHILIKLKNFISDFNLKNMVISGGVAANSELRKQITNIERCQFFIPEVDLCTDNAAMIAGLANFLPKLNPEEYKDLDVKDKILSFQQKKNLRS